MIFTFIKFLIEFLINSFQLEVNNTYNANERFYNI